METYWFIVISIILSIFFILDGYDFGTGIIHLFLAKKEKDKEVIAKAAGLYWDANEVWFVVAAALLFMAFPTYYASVFSGFYLPLIIILWLIIFRAIGLEFRSQFNYEMWKDIWDTSFGVSSLLLAFFFGVGLGNIVRGVNLGGVENSISTYEPHYFFLPLWNSSFSPMTSHPGVLDWFTIIIGLISVITLAIHGANWIIYKTNSSINKKLKTVIFRLTIVLIALTLFSLFIWEKINTNSFINFKNNVFLLIFPIIFLTGLFGLLFIKKFKKEIHGLIFSTLLILGGITSTLASLFPVILPSTNTINESLTIFNTSTTNEGLSVAFIWGIIGFILMITYLIIQNKLSHGKIDDRDYGH